MDEKKIFDVTPPKTPESIESAKNARKMMLGDPMIKQDTNATPEIDTVVVATAPEVNHQAKTIEPVSKVASTKTADPEPEKAESAVNEEPATEIAPEVAEPAAEVAVEAPKEATVEPAKTEPQSPEANEPAEPEKTEEPAVAETEPEEKEEPIKEINAVDSILPDDSQRAAAANKEAMQSPTMFDTKAYYVPIGNSQHKHGHAIGMIIAGLVASLFVLGTIYLYITFL